MLIEEKITNQKIETERYQKKIYRCMFIKNIRGKMKLKSHLEIHF